MRISSPNLVPIERSSVAALGLIALAAVAAYANSLAGDFVWDDRILVLDGRLARASDRIVEILTSDFFRRAETDNAYGYYRPLTTLSYLWDYAWWRLDPFGYHFTNVCLHAVNCLLSFVFIRQLGMSARVALVAGLVFAVHPIHTENVAWIAGRTDLLAYLFVLVAMMLHLRPRLAWLAPIAFAAGLLAKEMAIVAVAWVFLVDLVGRRHSLQQALRATLPFLVVVAAYGFWRIVVIDVPGPGAPAAHTPAAVALSAAPTLLGYLGALLWPVGQSAYIVNPYVASPLDPRFGLALAALIGSVAAGAVVVRRTAQPAPIVLAATMLAAALLPLAGVWRPAGPADMGAMMAERFAYFPSFPFVLLLALAVDAGLRANQIAWRVAAGGFALVAIAAGAAATVARNQVWRDEETFLETTLGAAPEATLLWGRLVQHHLERNDAETAAGTLARARAAGAAMGAAMWSAEAQLLQQQGRIEEAIVLQERYAQSTRKAAAPALNNLAYLYRVAGRRAEAKVILERLIAQGSSYGDVYANLAAIYRSEGDVASARRFYREALRDRPDDLETAGALVSLETEAGRPAAAERVYAEMLRYYPGDRRLRNNIALLRSHDGDDAGAAVVLADLITEHPGYTSARLNYANVLYRLGRHDEARAQLQAALPLVRGTELEAVVQRQLRELATQ